MKPPGHRVLVTALALAVVLGACMPGPNPLKDTPMADGQTAGFWLGLWHGLIGPVTFVTALFKDGTGFYEVHNNGGWYNAGFLLGLAVVLGGGVRGNVQLRRGAAGEDPGVRPAAATSPTPAERGAAGAKEPEEPLPPGAGRRTPN
jgi:hypothetical protein